MSCFYVYGYFEPSTGNCLYIGKGTGTRAWEHFAESSRDRATAFHKHLDTLLECNIIPLVVLISTGLAEQDAYELEKWLIRLIGRRDKGTGPLLNSTNGGEGVRGTNAGSPRSLATRRKISASRKANPMLEQQTRMLGLSHNKPVEAFDLDTGITILEFDSQASAARSGFNQGNIQACLKGQRRSHKGYGWRHASK